MYLLHTNTCR